MAVLLSHDDVRKQSEAVFSQFGERWMEFSQINSRLPNRRDPEELRNYGIGKFCVLAAMGESLEESIPILKKYRSKFDLITCDKGFPILMEAGIKPDFVQICDTNIPFKWLEPWVEETKDIKLLATSYANIEWTHKWKGPIYFYVNKDALDTQRKFLAILGNPQTEKHAAIEGDIQGNSLPPVRVIPAGSNVSNAMLIFMMGVDEKTQANWAGYEHYFLTGYDYSWRPSGKGITCKTGKYYASEDPRPKRFYMSHRTMLDINQDIVHASQNLIFSAKWLYSYVTAYDLPATNCSKRGILDIPRMGDLENILPKLNPSPEATAKINKALKSAMQATILRGDCVNAVEEARKVVWGGL